MDKPASDGSNSRERARKEQLGTGQLPGRNIKSEEK